VKEIRTDNTSRIDFHQFMLGAIIPRPIALVGTVSNAGIRNLAPFSYFNAVSSIPPVLMFSLSSKGPDSIKKDTLVNIEQTREFSVNMVSYSFAGKMALSSVEFPPETDEFVKTGFTSIESRYISAPRVKECPIQFECRLREIKELGSEKEDCTIVFGDVVCIHVDPSIIDENNRIDPGKLDIIGRLGRHYYSRISAESIFSFPQAMNIIPIGYDRLPEHIRQSDTLLANEIALIAGLPYELIMDYTMRNENTLSINKEKIRATHLQIREALNEKDYYKAVSLMMIIDSI
jgi:flavin reductase (DIM6/NTAB) family NADH-FMN oxidoreductase RutF